MGLISRLAALLILVALSPVFLIIMILSYLIQGSPVFYKHERVGYQYCPFSLYKFRTMVNNIVGEKITLSNDKRVTSWGNFLRAFKIDELPQLANILIGEMRFIGPRPEVNEYVVNNDFSFLEKVKPGLSDFSSILFRNESEILTNLGGIASYDNLLALKLDLAKLYANHKSFWLDIQLVIITGISIISPSLGIKLVKNCFLKRYNPEMIPKLDKFLF